MTAAAEDKRYSDPNRYAPRAKLILVGEAHPDLPLAPLDPGVKELIYTGKSTSQHHRIRVDN